MPYHWKTTEAGDHLTLWPHNSLTARGFVGFIGITSGLLAVPLIGLLGTPVLWVLLPFLLGAVAAIWVALRRNAKDRQISEEMVIGRDVVSLTRKGPGDLRQDWQANRYWVRPHLASVGGPVPQYLTLRGGPREVELGAFLTEEERQSLISELFVRLGSRP
jgi:uncharacterized membrane protein